MSKSVSGDFLIVLGILEQSYIFMRLGSGIAVTQWRPERAAKM